MPYFLYSPFLKYDISLSYPNMAAYATIKPIIINANAIYHVKVNDLYCRYAINTTNVSIIEDTVTKILIVFAFFSSKTVFTTSVTILTNITSTATIIKICEKTSVKLILIISSYILFI